MFQRSSYDPESGLPAPEEIESKAGSHSLITERLYKAGTMIGSYFIHNTETASSRPLLSDKKSTYGALEVEGNFDNDLDDPFFEEMQETKKTEGYYSFFYGKILQTKEMLQNAGGSISGYLIGKAFNSFNYSYALSQKLFSLRLSYGSIQDQSTELSQAEIQASLFKKVWEAKIDIEESLSKLDNLRININNKLANLQKLSKAVDNYILAISDCYRENITEDEFEEMRSFKNRIGDNLPKSIKDSSHYELINGLLDKGSLLYNESNKFLYYTDRAKAPPAIKPPSTTYSKS